MGYQQMKTMWKDTSRKDFMSSTSIGVAPQPAQPPQTITLLPSSEPMVAQMPLIQISSSCKHTELISYKVHKDQFKSLLVPTSKLSKEDLLTIKYRPKLNAAKSSASSGIRSTSKLNKIPGGKGSNPRQHSSRSRSRGVSESKGTEKTTSSEGDPDSATLVKTMFHVVGTESGECETSDECLSTDGEESDPNSPMCSDQQYLNQSTDLKAALIESKALVGDYVELKNCKRCGAMIFRVSI